MFRHKKLMGNMKRDMTSILYKYDMDINALSIVYQKLSRTLAPGV